MNPKNTFKIFFLLLIVFLNYYQGNTQSFVSVHYTSKDGLASSQVYDIHQDHNGRLWFATDNGLSRYDGNKFTNFSTKDGLSNNTIFNIYEGIDSTLWFTTFYKGLSIFDGNDFSVPAFNEQLLDGRLRHYKVYIGFNNQSKAYIISPVFTEEKVSSFQISDDDIQFSDNDSILITNDLIFYKSFFINNLTPNVKFTTIDSQIESLLELVGKQIKHDLKLPSKLLQLINFYQTRNHQKLITINKKLYQFKNGKLDLLKEFEQNILKVLEDKKGNLWLGLIGGGGALLYPNGNIFSPPIKLFKNQSITDILEDNSGSLWVSTLENSVHLIPNTDIMYIGTNNKLKDLKITSIAHNHKDIYFGTLNGHLYKLTEGQEILEINYTAKTTPILDLLYHSSDSLYLTNQYLVYHEGDSIYKHKKFIHNKSIKVLIETKDSSILCGSSNYVLSIDKNTIDGKIYVENRAFKRIYSLEEDKHSNIWIGTFTNVYKYTPKGNLENLSTIHPLFNERTTDIESDTINDLMFFATKGNGILVSRDTKLIFQYTKEKGLNSNQIKSVYLENDSTLWVGSNKGLNKLIYNYNNATFKIKNSISINTDHGLPSEAINKIVKARGYIWLATDNGLAYLKPTVIKKDTLIPQIKIQGIRTDDNKFIATSGKKLKSYQNSISINYTGVYLNSTDDIIYKYKLNGFDTKWTTTTNTTVQYTNLPYGSYTFKLSAKNKDNVWTEQPTTFNFIIQRHFTETLLFRFIVLSLLGLILYRLILFFIQRAEKREHIAKKSLESELESLRTQMNPHFMYNAMNSISYFISENDKKNAGIYLALFSSLMRKILENSKRKFISLNEEIETLETYLKLEKMRFNEQFDFQIHLDDSINKYESLIPPNIVQPFVENAVLHGIRYLEKDGWIQITFSPYQQGLLCSIEDNGIGRIQSERINMKRTRSHKSTGLKNTNDRINILNLIYNSTISLRVIDKYDSGIPKGTKVNLFLPFFESH